MTKRYTIKGLRQDIEKYNTYLSEDNHPYAFKIGQDSGATRLYHSLQQNKHTVLDTLESGSPKDCLLVMLRTYNYWTSKDFDLKYAQNVANDNLNKA